MSRFFRWALAWEFRHICSLLIAESFLVDTSPISLFQVISMVEEKWPVLSDCNTTCLWLICWKSHSGRLTPPGCDSVKLWCESQGFCLNLSDLQSDEATRFTHMEKLSIPSPPVTTLACNLTNYINEKLSESLVMNGHAGPLLFLYILFASLGF